MCFCLHTLFLHIQCSYFTMLCIPIVILIPILMLMLVLALTAVMMLLMILIYTQHLEKYVCTLYIYICIHTCMHTPIYAFHHIFDMDMCACICVYIRIYNDLLIFVPVDLSLGLYQSFLLAFPLRWHSMSTVPVFFTIPLPHAHARTHANS